MFNHRLCQPSGAGNSHATSPGSNLPALLRIPVRQKILEYVRIGEIRIDGRKGADYG